MGDHAHVPQQTVVVAEVVSIGDISLMAMNAVETLPMFLLISYHYFLIRIANAMEKDDVTVLVVLVHVVVVFVASDFLSRSTYSFFCGPQSV